MWYTASEATRLLGVSDETLQAWTEKYGYPRARVQPSGELSYIATDVQALRGALSTELSVARAIAVAQGRSAAKEAG
jgi:DNA-binding transcriptional MerR regulator